MIARLEKAPEVGVIQESAPWEIQAAVLGDPRIADCALLRRWAEEGQEEWILYFVPLGPVDQADLLARLGGLWGEAGPPIRLVALHKLPIRPDGALDTRALAAVPVLDERFLASREQQLSDSAGVPVTLARLEQPPPEGARYHLSDLLARDVPHPDEPEGDASAPPLAGLSPEVTEAPPAILGGSVLADRERIRDMTLLDALRGCVERDSARRLRFVAADGAVLEWSYRDLWSDAERIHAGLLAHGLRPGDRVIFQLLSNQDILAAFWACQMGGLIPVIVEVPPSHAQPSQALDRLTGLIRQLGEPSLLADASLVSALQGLASAAAPPGSRVCSIQALRGAGAHAPPHPASPEDIALFNLSSGSTGVPKCIMLSHRNLLTRAHGTNQCCPYSSTDVILNWLPLDHIGSLSDWHVRCVLLGCDLLYVDKDYILRQPLNWLTLIDRYRVTHSWAPSFAFSLVNRALNTSPPPEALDLSCIKGLLTAGEAVSDRSVLDFARAARRHGFPADAIWPAFGMAELASGITYQVPDASHPLRFHRIRQPALGSRVEPATDGGVDAVTFADLGPPIAGVDLRILDHEGRLLPREWVGRVQARGDMVFQGYFANPEATANALPGDGWLDTGDLGFLTGEGTLVLTGREKETIIIHGANYSSHEIEATVEGVAGVEPSFTAACGVCRAPDRTERLAVFFVPSEAAAGTQEEARLIRAIRAQVASRHGISPSYLVPLTRAHIPKTSIGKLQRSQLGRALEAGAFDAILKRLDLLLGNANTLPSWFHRATWVQRRAGGAGRYPVEGTTLILMDGAGLGLGLGLALARRLRELGRSCIEVILDDATVEGRGAFDGTRVRIDPDSPASFLDLFHRLQADGLGVAEVIHLLDHDGDESPLSGEAWRSSSLAAFLGALQALLATGSPDRRRILVVGSACHGVLDGDLGRPEQAMMSGFIKSLRLEHPALDSRHIDLPRAELAFNLESLLAELRAPCKEPLVAYRQGRRYVSRLRRLDLIEERRAPVALQPGGLYLVSGGLGGLGLALCRRLGREHGARLLIIDRAPPAGASRISADRLQRYRALRDEGIVCELAPVDVADARAIEAAVERAESTWGRVLDGIFHLAGVAHECALERTTPAHFAYTAYPKIQGVQALASLLERRPETFLLAFSSVNATFGGVNAGAYAAANAYLEAYCRRLQRAGQRVYHHAWTAWEGLGMSRHSGLSAVAEAKGFRSLSWEDGFQSLLALLRSGQPEALVGLDPTRKPVQSLILDGPIQQERLVGYCAPETSGTGVAPGQTLGLRDRFGTEVACRLEPLTPASTGLAAGRTGRDGLHSHEPSDPREEDRPRNPTEEKLLAIWRPLLAAREIGIRDSFFDLGGNSLSAVQLVVAIERDFGVQLPVGTVFHATTIAALAEILGAGAWSSHALSLVPIKPHGSRPPIFVIQSSTWDLVPYLEADQPVYGLNYGVGAKDRETMLRLPARLEDLAAHYVREIESIQPHGPYFLIGHSAAGLVTYEMARQLAAMGKELALVGLIDTFHPDNHPRRLSPSLRENMSELFSLRMPGLAYRSKRWASQRLKTLKTRSLRKESERPLSMRARRLYDAYRPQPYGGEIAYWKCMKRSRREAAVQDELKWCELAEAGVRVHPLDCDHDEIMKYPHVQALAEQITHYTRRS